jgi:hypothetical protein
MENDRFDNLTRLAATASRRAVLKALTAAGGFLAVRARGVASAQQGDCRAGTCTGCCNESGACLAGTTPNGCGVNGGPCVICEGRLDCISGVCLCGPTMCADGCCTGTECFPGTSSVACGTGAGACVDCDAQGLECHAGTCRGCDNVSCAAGCCSERGCEAGTSDIRCGWDGAACVACKQGQRCISVNRGSHIEHACACDGRSCPSGCCDPWANPSTLDPKLGGICHPGNRSEFCGKSGEQCKKCPPGEVCVNGVCRKQLGRADLPYVPHVPDGFAVDGGVGNAGPAEFAMGGAPLPADLPASQTYGHRSLRRDEDGHVDQQFVTFVFATPSGDDATAAVDRLFDAYPDAQPVAGGDADRAGQLTYAGQRDDGSPFAGRVTFGSIGDLAFVADLQNPLSDAPPDGAALDEAMANVPRNATMVRDETSPGSFGENGIPLVAPTALWYGSYTDRDNCPPALTFAPMSAPQKRTVAPEAGAPCDYAHLGQWAPDATVSLGLRGGERFGTATNLRSAGMAAPTVAATGQAEPERVEYFDGWIRRFANPEDAAADFQALPDRLAEASGEGRVNVVVQVDEPGQYRVVARLPLPRGEVAVYDAHLRDERIVGANIFSRPLGDGEVPPDYYQALHVALDAYQALFTCDQPCEAERAGLDEALRMLAVG